MNSERRYAVREVLGLVEQDASSDTVLVWSLHLSTAAALPCEMPVNGQNPRLRRGPSEAATKWAKRMEMTARRKMGLPIMETPAQE